MIILFLDLSTKSTGWCIGKDKKIIAYGCITTSSTNVLKRISVITEQIDEIIKQYSVDKIIAEEVRTDYKNVHTYKVLNWIQGIVIHNAYKNNPKIEYDFIQPSSWRSAIGIHTGRGIKRNQLKEDDIRYVKNKYHIDANDDVCDAICLMDAYYAMNSESEGFSWA